jgi:hypothetical protein
MSLALLQILHNVTGCPKSKMAADKPEKNNISGISQDIVLKFQHPVTSVSIRSSAIEFLFSIHQFSRWNFVPSCLEAEI